MERIMETLGWVSLIPVLVVIVMAIITKKAAESLIVGTFVGAAILCPAVYLWDHSPFGSDETVGGARADDWQSFSGMVL